MRFRMLIPIGLLLVLAVTLLNALLTRSGVGAFEYVLGFAVFALLLLAAGRLVRRA